LMKTKPSPVKAGGGFLHHEQVAVFTAL